MPPYKSAQIANIKGKKLKKKAFNLQMYTSYTSIKNIFKQGPYEMN